MSQRPVMSHDPLSGLEETPAGAETRVPEEAVTADEATASETGPLVLADSLTIGEVGDAYQALLRRLEGSDPVSIDGGAVEQVDGAGVQLLVAFVKDAAGRGLPVRWVAVSERLRSAAGSLGLAAALGFDDAGRDGEAA